MTHALLDLDGLEILPISRRENDLKHAAIMSLEKKWTAAGGTMQTVANRMVAAKKDGAAVVFMLGAHVLRSGVQRYLIDLIKRGLISCIAVNGACAIHDWEFALVGETTESVTKYIVDGRFGFWHETGLINEVVRSAAKEKIGLGEAVGKAIEEEGFAHKDISLFAAAYRYNVPITVHVGIGYDITHQHPNFDGASYGAASYTDFLKFAQVLSRLEKGVVSVFGSAVMAPEIFLKALSMVRNISRQKNRAIKRFTTLVCDLQLLPEDFQMEPKKNNPQYYFRPWKTLLIRTVRDGGKSYYVQGDHAETIPGLWTAIKEAESSKLEAQSENCNGFRKEHAFENKMNRETGKVIGLTDLAYQLEAPRNTGRIIVHCHGCFDLMHPGHIRYFQAAKAMGDILVVTVTPDRYVDKGPGRPVFAESLRAASIAALACVDYVSINRWETAEETLRLLRPHFYVKGQEFENRADRTGKLQRELAVVEEIGAQMRFTHEIVFSSTQLINKHLR